MNINAKNRESRKVDVVDMGSIPFASIVKIILKFCGAMLLILAAIYLAAVIIGLGFVGILSIGR